MNPGKLDTRVTLLSRTLSTDATGGAVETWSESVVVWASKEETAGRLFVAADRLQADTTTLFSVRYNTAITTQTRLRVDSVDYVLTAPPREDARYGRRQMMIVETKRLTPQGG